MGLSCNVSEINGNFRRKAQIFPHPPRCTLRPCWWGTLWNWVTVLGVKKLEWWGYQAKWEVWRYLYLCGYNTPTWHTDGRTDTGRQQRTCLRNVSRGNKKAGCQLYAVDVTVAEKTASNFRGLLFVAPCTTCQVRRSVTLAMKTL